MLASHSHVIRDGVGLEGWFFFYSIEIAVGKEGLVFAGLKFVVWRKLR